MLYPAFCTAAARLAPVVAAVAFTVARSVARLTLTSLTPATAFKAFSTRVTHEAQVMPSMGNWCSVSARVVVFKGVSGRLRPRRLSLDTVVRSTTGAA